MPDLIDLDNPRSQGDKREPKKGGPLPIKHRWGVECRDGEGATIVPNWMLDWAVPMLRARGLNSRVAKSLWLVIIHLSRYRYEKPNPECSPAVKTIASQIGLTVRQCQRLFEKLEGLGLLRREIRGPHGTTIYDYTPFSLAVRAYSEEAREEITEQRRLAKEKENASKKRYREGHREELAAYQKRHREKNPDKMREWGHRRRALKAGAEGSHTDAEFMTLVEACGRFCPKCGVKMTRQDGSGGAKPTDLTEDHVIPLSKGGTDDISNIRPLCRSCNASKCDRLPDAGGDGDMTDRGW